MSAVSWFAPGRLEIFGKHTDYAGGRSILAAIDRGIKVSVMPAKQGITIRAGLTAQTITLNPHIGNSYPSGHWSHYLQTVIDRLSSNFAKLAACEIQITSDLPSASGMSSSSALITAVSLALADFNELPSTDVWKENIPDILSLAGYLACVENGQSFASLAGHKGVGTFGGSEDHVAILCCEPDTLSAFSFCPIRLEQILPFPKEYSFVILSSGILAEKTGDARHKYNNVSLLVKEIEKRWSYLTGRTDTVLAEVLATEPQAKDKLNEIIAGETELQRRLEAFLIESEELIPEALKALATNNMKVFGELAYKSHENADKNLGNQIPHTNKLVELAADTGAIGASAFGAGFGGAVWALVPNQNAEDFAQDWLRKYIRIFPECASRAETFITRPSGGARPIAAS